LFDTWMGSVNGYLWVGTQSKRLRKPVFALTHCNLSNTSQQSRAVLSHALILEARIALLSPVPVLFVHFPQGTRLKIATGCLLPLHMGPPSYPSTSSLATLKHLRPHPSSPQFDSSLVSHSLHRTLHAIIYMLSVAIQVAG
jgi:hypothetical protein